MKTKIIHNRIRCKACGDVIESTSEHDFKMCSCETCGVDGGQDYLRRVGDKENWEEMSEIEYIKDEQNGLEKPKAPCMPFQNVCGGFGQYGWICPKCGAVMSPNERYCPYCCPPLETKITC